MALRIGVLSLAFLLSALPSYAIAVGPARTQVSWDAASGIGMLGVGTFQTDPVHSTIDGSYEGRYTSHADARATESSELKILGEALASSSVDWTGYSIGTSAEAKNWITIIASTPGTIVYPLLFSASLSASGSGGALVRFGSYIDGVAGTNFSGYAKYDVWNNGGSSSFVTEDWLSGSADPGHLTASKTVIATLQPGLTYTLFYSMEGHASASGGWDYPSSGQVSSLNSLGFGGDFWSVVGGTASFHDDAGHAYAPGAPAVVPEPASLLLLVSGLGALRMCRKPR